MSKLGRTCTQCQGRTWEPTGDNDPTPVPCGACDSTGYEKIGEVDTSDLEDNLNNALVKLVDIKEKVDEIMDKLNEE